MSIRDDLVALDAPPKLLEAADEIQKCLDAGINPPRGLVVYLERWVYRQHQQNRYGK